MNKYNVTLQAVVNVRVSGVEAGSPREAIRVAEGKIDLHGLFDRQQPIDGVEFTAYTEDIQEALVDRVGDEEHKGSRWFWWHRGKWWPRAAAKLKDLKHLDREAGHIRNQLGLSDPGEVVWQAESDFDELLVVVADGYGGAGLLRVEGSYPLDYLLKEERKFDSEDAACVAAQDMLDGPPGCASNPKPGKPAAGEKEEAEGNAPRVILSVKGGVADVILKPKGIAVAVFDYDVQGDTGLSQDPDGSPCRFSEWPSSALVVANKHWPIVKHAPRTVGGLHSRRWRCDKCKRTVNRTYEEIAVAGAPYCPGCGTEMRLA